MIEIGSIIKCSFSDTVKRIKSFRFVTAILMVLTLTLAVTSGIDRLIADVKIPMTVWIVPHIFDNVTFAAFYGIILCYLLSEIPFFNSSELFVIARMGRKRWFISKMLSIVFTTFTFTVVSFFVCFISFFPNITVTSDWGKLIKTMTYGTNLYSYNIICRPSAIIINDFTPQKAMLLGFLMVWLISVMMGFIMFTISIFVNRITAIVIAAISALIGLSQGLFFTVQFLPYISLITWFRVSIYGNKIFLEWYYPPLSTVVKLAFLICVVCLAASAIKIKHTEFEWIDEA